MQLLDGGAPAPLPFVLCGAGGVLGGSDSSSAPCPARAAPGTSPALHHHLIRVLLPASGHPMSVIWVLGVLLCPHLLT